MKCVRDFVAAVDRRVTALLSQRERKLDGDLDRDGLAHPGARRKAPLPCSLDGLVVQSKGRIERPDDLNISHRTVRPDRALQQHSALNFGAHRVARVLRLDLAENARERHAVARLIDTATGATAKSLTQSRSDA